MSQAVESLAREDRRRHGLGDLSAPRRVALAHLLDALGESVMVCDTAGRELQRTARLADLLAGDPDRERILGDMRALGRSLGLRRVDCADAPGPSIGALEVGTSVACYRLRGTCGGAGLLGPDEVVLVSLERLTPELPSVEQLVERRGLTRRQAEVALLLARGMSNREIAGHLSVSSSTVRRHAEWVFTKLRVHSRKALALVLLRRDPLPAG
ncbi:MAG: response regulator transcription factor [Gemmatimonadaceae bacterium]